jgi:predicted phosphodiesterase
MALPPARRSCGVVLAAAIGAAVCAAGPSCIRSTPFGADPSVKDVTATNLAKLRAREPAPRPFKIAALGDTHADYDNVARTVEVINARDDIELVLIAGDMTDAGLLQEFEWSYEMYARLDVPFLTVIGNHDALGHGADIYREMYGPYDYSFVFGGIKFVMFNSNTLEFEGAAPDREWLSAEVDDLDGAQGAVLVLHHDPTHPDDYPDGTTREFYEALIQRPGVIGAIHGHLASFELIQWHGVPVLQCGTYENVFLHSIITFDGTTLSFQVCAFEACSAVEPVVQPELP